MDTDLYVLCSDDDIVLKHSDNTNDFQMSFDVLEAYENVSSLIEQNMFFTLLSELNPDIIVDCSETSIGEVRNVICKINSPKDASLKIFKKCIYLHISYSMHRVNQNETILSAAVAAESATTAATATTDDDDALTTTAIALEHFYMSINKTCTNGTHFVIKFSFDNKINDVTNKFIALFLKKLIKKIKQYFDMI